MFLTKLRGSDQMMCLYKTLVPSDLKCLFVRTTAARSCEESSSSNTFIQSSLGNMIVVVVSGCDVFQMFRRYATIGTVPPRRRGGRLAPLPTPRAPSPSPIQDTFNAPFYTLKAFAIATAIVLSTASASVAGVMAYLDVHNVGHPTTRPSNPTYRPQTTEFAARMRTIVSQSMPILTAKIYRRPTSLDSVPDDPVLFAASHLPSTSETFGHDAAQQRLADAFDKGSFDAWAETAVRELEAEIEVERTRQSTAS